MRRIILVDDNADMRTSLDAVLRAEGYFVRAAAQGRRALELQREEPADVLLTDIFMPDIDGFELVAGFRKEFPGTKIVVMSGDSRIAKRNYLEDAKLMGVDATLQKPFDPEMLFGLLRSL